MMSSTEPKVWLTVSEAAAHANVCRDVIYDACERGELQHVRIAGRRAIRLRAGWVDEWLTRFTVSAQPRAGDDVL
jgi:excisionase family DNA binding protein